MTTKRFLGLDGLRGVCALTILFYHSKDIFHEGSFFQHGYLAVDVFFILSGFVIALTYEQRLWNGGHASEFLYNRANRLFPTYWLGAALNIVLFIAMAASGFLAAGDSWWMIWLFIPLTTLLLIPDYITPDGVLYPAMDSVAWSLFAEWGAYIAYGFGLFRWKTPALLMLAVSGWAIMTVAGYHTGTAWCTGAHRPTLFTWGILRCVSAFAAGVVIYRVHTHALFERLPVVSTEILLAAWVAIAVIPTYTATPTLDAIIVIILCPILVCLLVRSDHKAPAYCKRLGALSYPLYVVHPGIMLVAVYTPVFGLSHGPRPLNAVLVVGLCIGLAWALSEVVARISRRRVAHVSARKFSGVASRLPHEVESGALISVTPL